MLLVPVLVLLVLRVLRAQRLVAGLVETLGGLGVVPVGWKVTLVNLEDF